MLTKIKDISPQFLVKDINRSIEFYTKNLDFEITFLYGDFYCGIAKDGYSIHLKSATPSREERENRKKNEHVDITISVDYIEEIYQHIISKPVTILQQLREMPYGKEFYIADPDGYIISFLEQK